ncbi:Pyruvate decarboxylase [Colletotrichum fructicola]|uniref:Pyruvate decarboxylase n=1 Tax=Colletotrichum fructicola (strain Nara gc5) TaxID=1213859 RepID=L2FQP2_COLFN|nr:Pyruvate decarboxylase [Colletotrichum fructicola]KAE9572768.1 Pyruvate decarboxylase [Colletotrichum fructicola]KAF4424817.1 Pyruvate decarboxylase [Colletotrichum fructicola]KAF4489946.1 Pyruvate decarboxylase [Colletotrichum fructicola Nara gc5]KAF4906126.1 Pyruvate decarboxylase [Colletotrichum fructicola]
MGSVKDSSAPTIKLAEYLFTRLRQLGIDSVHGVPGDFNLHLLDYVKPSRLHWVGNANELNAGYAADGYARIKGIGALITTSGVGELSAINAIAGAYAERAAVVHIVGTPSRHLQDNRVMLHHGFNDGEYRRFAQMHSHVTVAQASLRSANETPAQIDEVLRQCLVQSRPVYIEVPQDLVSVPISAHNLEIPVWTPSYTPTSAEEAALAAILDRASSAQSPLILVDGEIRPLGIVEDVQKIVASTGWPTWTTPLGKSLIDETLPNFHGIYKGKHANSTEKELFGSSDLILYFGPHLSSTNTNQFSMIPRPEASIIFTDTEVKIGTQVFRDVTARAVVRALSQQLKTSNIHRYDVYPELPKDFKISFADIPRNGKIDQSKIWHLLANVIRPGDVVLGETGTSGHGSRVYPMPQHSRLFLPSTWLSIGYMLPAAQGAALAQRELIQSSKYHSIEKAQTILFIGDGSFQMTVQELSSIIRNNLDVIVFLINNDGYTIERCIHGLEEGYNDVARWRYLQAPSFFGARQDSYVRSAKTWGELEDILGDDKLINGKGLRMVEIFMDIDDAPEGALLDLMNAEKKRLQTM